MFYLIEGVDTCLYTPTEKDIKNDARAKLEVDTMIRFYHCPPEGKRRRLYEGKILQISSKLNIIERGKARVLAERQKKVTENSQNRSRNSRADDNDFQQRRRTPRREKRKSMSNPVERGSKQSSEDVIKLLRKKTFPWRANTSTPNKNDPARGLNEDETTKPEICRSSKSSLRRSRSMIGSHGERNANNFSRARSSTLDRPRRSHESSIDTEDETCSEVEDLDFIKLNQRTFRTKGKELRENPRKISASNRYRQIYNSDSASSQEDFDKSVRNAGGRKNEERHRSEVSGSKVNQTDDVEESIKSKVYEKETFKKSHGNHGNFGSSRKNSDKNQPGPSHSPHGENLISDDSDDGSSHDGNLKPQVEDSKGPGQKLNDGEGTATRNGKNSKRQNRNDLIRSVQQLLLNTNQILNQLISLDDADSSTSDEENLSAAAMLHRKSPAASNPPDKSSQYSAAKSTQKGSKTVPKNEKPREVHNSSSSENGSHERNLSTNILRADESSSETESQRQLSDTEWQLQYTKKDVGVIELMEGTGVFVKANLLDQAKRSATGQNTLARALMDLIFTREALYTCSLKGKTPKGLGKHKVEVPRPGLDEAAVTTILNFVTQFRKERRWPKMDDRIIEASMRNKLQELKSECPY